MLLSVYKLIKTAWALCLTCSIFYVYLVYHFFLYIFAPKAGIQGPASHLIPIKTWRDPNFLWVPNIHVCTEDMGMRGDIYTERKNLLSRRNFSFKPFQTQTGCLEYSAGAILLWIAWTTVPLWRHFSYFITVIVVPTGTGVHLKVEKLGWKLSCSRSQK